MQDAVYVPYSWHQADQERLPKRGEGGDDAGCAAVVPLHGGFAHNIYLANWTRPDLAYAVSKLCRFMHNPGEAHVAELKRLLRYLEGTSVCYTKLGTKITSR